MTRNTQFWRVSPSVRRPLCAFLSALALGVPAFAQNGEVREALNGAREAAKSGDAAKAKELCIRALEAAPNSLVTRFEIAQITEARKEPALAREHYAEIVNAAERAARFKEKLSDEDAKAAKDAASRAKSLTDAYAQSLSKALKAYSDAILKIARLAKTQGYYKFAGDLCRVVKDMFDHTPGVLDSRDPREVECGKIINECVQKSGDSKTEPDKMRGDVSEIVATLAKDLTTLGDQALATYEEVRGPYTRRRALLPPGMLVSLRNDPDGNAEKSKAVWNRARDIEPSITLKLRLANDASRYTLTVNGLEAANSKGKSDALGFGQYREVDVKLFKELNYIAFYGHEIADGSRKGGRGAMASRVWMLIDIPVSEKEHITTDGTWTSLAKPPAGWEVCPIGCFVEYPLSPIAGSDFWDYERTKTWKGFTLAGDPADCWLRKAFDLPAGVEVTLGAKKAADTSAPER
jgi:hypothetical protein